MSRLPPRSATRAAALVALAAAAALVPSSAAAQPACVAGTLADYLAIGATGCRLGGFTFANFALTDDVLLQENATVLPPDLARGVFPFEGGSIGIPGFGFQFEELFTGVQLDTDAPTAGGRVRSTFAFTFQSATLAISEAALIGGVFVDDAANPADLAGAARFTALLGGGGATCLDVALARTDAETGLVFDVAEACAPTPVSSGAASWVMESELRRVGGQGPASGLAGSGVIVASFIAEPSLTAVPEPATAALAAGGLLALGAFAARRRRG